MGDNNTNTSLQAMSYNISCDHIRKLNEIYNKNNEMAYNQHFKCIETAKTDDDRNMRYLTSSYVSKKDCIFTSTEPDELLWAKVFDVNSSMAYKDDNATVKFNENTRRKIISR